MSVFIHPGTKIITQGITGKTGRVYTELCMNYGVGKTSFVAGVNPKKAGEMIFDIPIYGTVKEAKEKTGATVSVIYVPAPAATAAIWEAVEADLDVVVCTTEGVPVKDMLGLCSKMRSKEAQGGKKTLLLGPGSPGIMIPEVLKIGMIPDFMCRRGGVGVVTNSGAVMYEAFALLEQVGLAPSCIVGLGRGSILGLKSIDVLQALNTDVDTEAVVLIAETGGADITETAKWYQKHMSKPVVVYIAGMEQPLKWYMSGRCAERQNNQKKIEEIARSYGFKVARTLADISALLRG